VRYSDILTDARHFNDSLIFPLRILPDILLPDDALQEIHIQFMEGFHLIRVKQAFRIFHLGIEPAIAVLVLQQFQLQPGAGRRKGVLQLDPFRMQNIQLVGIDAQLQVDLQAVILPFRFRNINGFSKPSPVPKHQRSFNVLFKNDRILLLL